MTDQMGPRLAASQLKLRAEKMIIEKLDEMGFSNPRTEYAYDFAKGGWDNKMNYVAMTAPYYCSFAANPKAWSGSTAGLVKGECVLLEAKTMEDVEKLKGTLSGKVAVMPATQTYEMKFTPLASRYTEEELAELAKDPRAESGAARRMYYGGSQTDRQVQQALMALLKEEKVLAVVSGGGTFNVPSSRGVQYKVGEPEPTPEVVLPIEDHCRMARMLAKGEKVEMELNIKNEFTDNQRINNVIAEIPGSDPKLKDEIVLIGAHFDSWHGGTGGADNASGCIVMVEAMRIIKALGIKPKRTIRLALWGGEEQGLYGSYGYANSYLLDSIDSAFTLQKCSEFGRNFFTLVGTNGENTEFVCFIVGVIRFEECFFFFSSHTSGFKFSVSDSVCFDLFY